MMNERSLSDVVCLWKVEISDLKSKRKGFANFRRRDAKSS